MSCIRSIRDPHHDSTCEWGWDGRHLYHRHNGQSEWTKVSRVSFTPARILAIASLLQDLQP